MLKIKLSSSIWIGRNILKGSHSLVCFEEGEERKHRDDYLALCEFASDAIVGMC